MATDTYRDSAAAYVLGVLDADEMVAFEAHLAGCDLCAAEVESLLPTALSLGEVSPNQAVVMHIIYSADPVENAASGSGWATSWPRLSTAVGNATALVRRALAPTSASHRRAPSTARHGRADLPPAPRRRRRGVLAATGAASVALAFVLGTQFSSGSEQGAPPDPGANPTASLPSTAVFEDTDPRTGVHTVLAIAEAAWGSHVWLTLDNVRGPLRCELIAVGRDGALTSVASWRVPAPGYGIAEVPEPLTVEATTSVLLRETREFVIRALPPSGDPYALVTVPV